MIRSKILKQVLSLLLSFSFITHFYSISCFCSAPHDKQIISPNLLTKRHTSLPIDFTTLESVDFYGGFGPIQPDRVYLNEAGEKVAFFSRQKCIQLKSILKQAAEKYYLDHRALLYSEGYKIQYIIDDDNDKDIPTNQRVLIAFKSTVRNIFSGFSIYPIITT